MFFLNYNNFARDFFIYVKLFIQVVNIKYKYLKHITIEILQNFQPHRLTFNRLFVNWY